MKDIFSSLKQNGDVLMEKKDKAESIVNKVIENVLEDTAVETVAEAATVSGIVEVVKEFYNGWTPHFVLSKD